MEYQQEYSLRLDNNTLEPMDSSSSDQFRCFYITLLSAFNHNFPSISVEQVATCAMPTPIQPTASGEQKEMGKNSNANQSANESDMETEENLSEDHIIEDGVTSSEVSPLQSGEQLTTDIDMEVSKGEHSEDVEMMDDSERMVVLQIGTTSSKSPNYNFKKSLIERFKTPEYAHLSSTVSIHCRIYNRIFNF